MKNKYILSIASLCFAALTFAGCEDKIQEGDYMKLDAVTADFAGIGNEPVTITVDSNQPIKVEADKNEDWILVSDVQPGSFTVNVKDNDTGFYRSGIITITAGSKTQQFNVYQIMQDNEFNAFIKLRTNSDGISATGKHIAADVMVYSEDGTYGHQIEYIDTTTKEKIVFDPISSNILKISDIVGVSDNGHIYVSIENGGTALFDIKTMTYSMVQGPVSIGDTNPWIFNVSSDGTKAVGRVQGRPNVQPILWENGAPRILESPEKSWRDGPAHYGVIARGISADGTIIYGSSWEGFDGGLVWWKNGELMGYAGGTDEVTGDKIHFVSDQKAMIDQQLQFKTNGLSMQSGTYQISSKGTYIGGFYRIEVTTESGLEPAVYPAFFNTVTNKTRVFTDLPEGIGSTATEDGLGIVNIGATDPGKGAGITDCYVVNITNGEILGTLQEWILEEKGLQTPFAGIMFINDDRSVIYAATYEGLRYMQWYISPAVKK